MRDGRVRDEKVREEIGLIMGHSPVKRCGCCEKLKEEELKVIIPPCRCISDEH